MTDTFTLEARNSTLEDMIEILREQRSRRIDLVVPASALRMSEGLLELRGADKIEHYEDIGDGQKMLLDSFDPNGLYRPTRVFDEHIADRFGMNVKYVRKMRSDRPDLLDANVNGWLHGRRAKIRKPTRAEAEAAGIDFIAADCNLDLDPSEWHWDDQGPARDGNLRAGQWWKIDRQAISGDGRTSLLRLFGGSGMDEGIARAWLSDRFFPVDHFDVLTSVAAGLEQAGLSGDRVQFDRLDLTERGFYGRVAVPEIRAMAPELLKGYRNPFGNGGAERAAAAVRGRDIDEWREVARREGMAYSEEEGGEPVVFAGFGFSNSETGGGALSIWPEVIVQICKNGLRMNAFASTRRHVGARLDAGVQWRQDTTETALDLVVKQTRDVVAQFVDGDFLQARVDEIEAKAGAKIDKPTERIKQIGKTVGFSDAQVDGILGAFIRGGQMTAGGVANAVTAYSQTVRDADEANDLDNKAMRVLELASA